MQINRQDKMTKFYKACAIGSLGGNLHNCSISCSLVKETKLLQLLIEWTFNSPKLKL